MNATELKILQGLRASADACFDDLKQLGAISRPNAMDYRKFRQQAEDLETETWRAIVQTIPERAWPRLHRAVDRLRDENDRQLAGSEV